MIAGIAGSIQSAFKTSHSGSKDNIASANDVIRKWFIETEELCRTVVPRILAISSNFVQRVDGKLVRGSLISPYSMCDSSMRVLTKIDLVMNLEGVRLQ